jgi:molybdopterin biosynthesis enzyme MoaB
LFLTINNLSFNKTGRKMDNKFKAGVLTISDKGSRGERVDESGDLAVEMLGHNGFVVTEKEIVPDSIEAISSP